MKKYVLIKEIMLGLGSIEPSEIPFEFKDGRYIRGFMPLPDFINISNTDYFKEYIESKFKIGEYVIFKESKSSLQPQKIIDIKSIKDKTVYNIENIFNGKTNLNVSEKDLKKTVDYYFINSDGKVQCEFYGVHPKKDNWLIGSAKYFDTKREAGEASNITIYNIKTFELKNGINND